MTAGEREIGDDELMDVADGPAQAASLHKALRTIAGNPSVGPELQEMARGVLSGRIGMKDVVGSEKYLHAIGERLDGIRDAAEHLSPEDRRRSDERASRMLREAEEVEDGRARRGDRR